MLHCVIRFVASKCTIHYIGWAVSPYLVRSTFGKGWWQRPLLPELVSGRGQGRGRDSIAGRECLHSACRCYHSIDCSDGSCCWKVQRWQQLQEWRHHWGWPSVNLLVRWMLWTASIMAMPHNPSKWSQVSQPWLKRSRHLLLSYHGSQSLSSTIKNNSEQNLCQLEENRFAWSREKNTTHAIIDFLL